MAADAFDLWKQTDGAARPVAGYYVHGFGPTLALTLPNRVLSDAGWRLIAAILGATIVGLLFWLGGWTGERASRLPGPWSGVTRPALLGAAAGVFWWLEMEPSWLGLVVVVVSLIIMLRSRRFRVPKLPFQRIHDIRSVHPLSSSWHERIVLLPSDLRLPLVGLHRGIACIRRTWSVRQTFSLTVAIADARNVLPPLVCRQGRRPV